MTVAKLKIAPGYVWDSTFYSNTGGWYDGDKVRFRNGFPEKIGGWQKFTTEQYLGSCRNLFCWAALDGTVYTGMGTNVKYYISGGSINGLQDVTPVVWTTAKLPDGSVGAAALTTTSGSKSVIIYDATYSPVVGQYVILSGATGTVNNIPATEINAEHVITSIIDASHYTIEVTTQANATGSGFGSNVKAEYELQPGLNDVSLNTGWGVGPWGGAVSPITAATLSNAITTSVGSSTVTVNWPSHGIPTSPTAKYWVQLSGVTPATGSIGGIPVVFFNTTFEVVSVPDANHFTITTSAPSSLATSAVTGGGSTTSAKYWSSASSTGWGDPNNGLGASDQLRLWTSDNYGERLIACVRNGGIYEWSPDYAEGRMINIADDPVATVVDAPVVATQIMMSDIGQHLIAFGANVWGATPAVQDTMNVRWSDSEDIYNWDEADTTKLAGSVRLGVGSFISTAAQTKDEILIWTDAALYSMKPSGDTNVFNFSLLATNTNIVGPNSVVIANNTAFWMGLNNFYYYDGAVYTLPSTVRDKVFLNLNLEQSYKVFAGKNSEFNEVTWFYPSTTILYDENNQPYTNTENDSYVTFNYVDKIWYFGTIARTAWLDAEFNNHPLGATPSADGYVYEHEVGDNDGSTPGGAPINAWILSSPVEIEDGENFSFVRRIIPDITFRNSDPTKTVAFTIYPQNYPGAEIGSMDSNNVNLTAGQTYDLDVYTNQVFTRLRGRSVILKVQSDQQNIAWRLGTPRLEIVQDGRR
jgi:hypothetical protein